MEILLFTFVGVTLYVISDAIVKAIEKKRGEVLPNRSMIFFGIIMTMSLVTFSLLETYGPELGLLPTATPTQENTAPIPQTTEIPQDVSAQVQPTISQPQQTEEIPTQSTSK